MTGEYVIEGQDMPKEWKQRSMIPFDDFPQRTRTYDIAEAAEKAFRDAIQSCQLFVVQQQDRNDYGTDIQLRFAPVPK